MTSTEVAACASLEAASYPADEAASPERLAWRQREVGQLFWGAFDAAALVGFVCATLAEGKELTHESMSNHVPGGSLLCVHSVVVCYDLRRKGVASVMLREYLRAVACGQEAPKCCALMCKSDLIPLYTKVGFRLIGVSPVVHGSERWFELRIDDLARTARAELMLQIDAFASKPCTGNPAAVVFTQRQGNVEWMQSIAVENNLSETAFVERLHEDGERFSLRWFTPGCEVELCGHATLAAAEALWSTGQAKRRKIEFSTASGVLSCTPAGDWVQMVFPADPPTLGGEKAALASALGLKPEAVLEVGRGRFDVLVEVTPSEFDTLQPNQTALAEFDCRGVVVTAAGCTGPDGVRAAEAQARSGHAEIDFRSRWFGPRVGVPEDPVTGSAHCMLAPYWVSRLGRKPTDGGSVVVGFQASRRGGIVRCELRGEGGGAQSVVLSGQAVVTLEGTLLC